MSTILEVRDLRVKFKLREKELTVIRNVDFHLQEGETVAIVGESGSGKSVFTKALMGMLDKNGWIDSGIIKYKDEYIQNYTQKDWLQIRGSEFGMIFQDPMTALNPLKKIGVQISETLIYHKNKQLRKDAQDEISKLYQYNTPKTINTIKELSNELVQVDNKLKALKYFTKNGIKDLYELIKRHHAEIKLEKSINVVNTKQSINDIKKKAKKIGFDPTEQIEKLLKTVDLMNEQIDLLSIETVKEIKEELPVIEHKIKDDVKEIGNLEIKKAKLQAELRIKEKLSKQEYQSNKNNDFECESKKTQEKEIKVKLKNDLELVKGECIKEAIAFLDLVGIPDAENRYHQYPFEFSGGMRQRVVIAIAICTHPKVLICDEPTTALDVTIQSQILRLIKELQDKFNMSVIFITHDLGVVANVSDRVAVMYGGEIVEYGTSEEIFYDAYHPYTNALLKSLPQLGVKGEELFSIEGTPPNFAYKIEGDAFAQRNPLAMKIDFIHNPPFFKITDTHYAKTWLLHPQGQKNLSLYKKELK
jgi:oligopeptide transport system ATP-binding protein